jgi:hypothetical protein
MNKNELEGVTAILEKMIEKPFALILVAIGLIVETLSWVCGLFSSLTVRLSNFLDDISTGFCKRQR